jgi:cyclophilin family peptidyl-prolyl cis-trans isomerase
VPSDKRARQRAAREARLAAEAKNKKRRQQVRNGGIIVVVAGVVIGAVFLFSSSGPPKKATVTTTTVAGETKADVVAQTAANTVAVKAGCPASTATRVNTQTYKSAPAMTIDKSKLYSATVKTTLGSFTIALNAKTASVTVNNFVFLADKGFFNCNIFWRVIPQEFVQTGDPTGVGTGSPGYTIPDELPAKAPAGTPQYPAGSVAMGNTGAANSGGSQWFVVTGGTYQNLQPSYSLFGRVISGMSVVDAITAQGNAKSTSNGHPPEVTQRILSVTIHEGSGL